MLEFHFSHDHPLTIFSRKEVDDDDHKAWLCSICGLPILSCPSYVCSKGCKFFLHKPCAKLLPEKLFNPRHHNLEIYPHTLHLKPKSPASSELCQNFTYQCRSCNFDMHPLLAQPVEIKSIHESHPSHPLVAICRETSSLCDACGEKQTGFFFSCQECDFWIHQDCTVLPRILHFVSHPHSSITLYSRSSVLEKSPPSCIICSKSLLSKVGLYFCCECSSYAHVSCARSNKWNDLESGTTLDLLIRLPANEDDTFPSLVIRRNLLSNLIPDETLYEVPEHHIHPLVFYQGSSSRTRKASNLVCDICVQPVNNSSPFCECHYCDFLAHYFCLSLPSVHDIRSSSEEASNLVRDIFTNKAAPIKAFLLQDTSRSFFSSIFPCLYCRRPCNGFCYVSHGFVLMLYDLECTMSRNTSRHDSHGQHVLFRTTRVSEAIPLTCCSKNSLVHDVYRCILCDEFYIHVRCALLPKTIRHDFDEHPLELITPSPSEHEHEHNYCPCEICEKDIDHKPWYYGCHKCKQYFHINCIPSVGYLSKVQFGKTLSDNEIHRDHPLTLTRMLTHGRNEMCKSCNEIIGGFVDEMAFRCLECDFWVHFSCTWNSLEARGTGLIFYRNLEKFIESRVESLKQSFVNI